VGINGGMGKVIVQLNELQSENGWGTKKFLTDDTVRGRYPSNVIHDGSDEVMNAFAAYGEVASAGRYFMSYKDIYPCGLCRLPLWNENGINEECSHVFSAADNSNPSGTERSSDFALNDAPVFTQHGREDTSNLSHVPVLNVASYSLPCHLQTASTAQTHADPWPLEKIVRNVKSAARLCDSCATAIAQSLAASRRGQDPEPPLSQVCIEESHKPILIRSLAQYVAHRVNTDIILTIESLKGLFGSVFYAIAENISSAKSANSVSTDPGHTRFRYSSKADWSDRWTSKHPTIKPVNLIRYLVKLVCPPDGLFLDPFAGSGTAAAAAYAEGRRAILIEKEDKYYADIRKRVDQYETIGWYEPVRPKRSTPIDDDGLLAMVNKESNE
jgi:hypothetical protein